MSQENVEIVRAHIEAFNRLDGSALAFFDPHVVLDMSRVTGLDFGTLMDTRRPRTRYVAT